MSNINNILSTTYSATVEHSTESWDSGIKVEEGLAKVKVDSADGALVEKATKIIRIRRRTIMNTSSHGIKTVRRM